MKTLFNFTQKILGRIGVPTAALLLIVSPVLISAQPVGHYFPDGDPAIDTIHQRMNRRMAEINQRFNSLSDSLTDYLRDIDPGDDASVWLSPGFPPMPSFDFFDNPDMDGLDLSETDGYFPMIPPVPDFEFDFSPDVPGDWNEENDFFNFFRGSPDDRGFYMWFDHPDSLGWKPCQKGKSMVIVRRGNDSIVLDGNNGTVYSIADSNGVVMLKGYKLADDSLLSDSTGTYFFSYSDNDGEPRKQFRWNIDRKRGNFREPRATSRGYYMARPDAARSSTLADLNSRDIANLKNSDLKPARKTVPLGIDDLRVNLLRDSQQLRLRFDLQAEAPMNVQVFDRDGSIFHDETLRKSNGRYDNRITLPDEPSDEFYLRITSGKQSLIKKIVL